jgi:metal-responsive CopG/Arc/MetJ family transcriptional regulator
MQSMSEPTKIAVNFDSALLAALDEHRRQLRDLPTRSEAIRRAVAAVTGASIEESRGQKASRKASAR